jgi:hypothetical protein
MYFFLSWFIISLPEIWSPIQQKCALLPPSAFPMFPVRIVIDVRSVTRHLFSSPSRPNSYANCRVTFFIRCIVRAKGVGPIIRQPSTLHGGDLSWAMLISQPACLMSCISNMATLVTYTRHILRNTSCLSEFADRICRAVATRRTLRLARGVRPLLRPPLPPGSSSPSLLRSISSAPFGHHSKVPPCRSSLRSPYGPQLTLLDMFLDD